MEPSPSFSLLQPTTKEHRFITYQTSPYGPHFCFFYCKWYYTIL